MSDTRTPDKYLDLAAIAKVREVLSEFDTAQALELLGFIAGDLQRKLRQETTQKQTEIMERYANPNAGFGRIGSIGKQSLS